MFIVYVYDVADEPILDGVWEEYAHPASRDELAITLGELYAQAYGSVSIDVYDENRVVPEELWPPVRKN